MNIFFVFRFLAKKFFTQNHFKAAGVISDIPIETMLSLLKALPFCEASVSHGYTVA